MMRKTREKVMTAAAIICFIIAGIGFWKLISALMWACHDAGVPM